VSSVQHFDRYNLLASAIAGRTLEVAPIEPGASAWTDGTTIFIAADTDPRDALRSIAVQAALLAAHSLTPEIVTRLDRRAALVPRYLAVEGHRALAAHDDLVPPLARSLRDPVIAAVCNSPADSLMRAESSEAIADAPAVFGTIRPRTLLKSRSGPEATSETLQSRYDTRGTNDAFTDADHDDGTAFELSSAWVGRGGAIGRLLKRLFSDARVGGSGPPGSDETARWSRRSTRVSPNAVPSTARAPRLEAGEVGPHRGNRYPEWDRARARYRPDWCTVVEVEPETEGGDGPGTEGSRALRRPLARVGLGLERRHRELQGDDVDLDAAVEAFVARAAGTVPDEACYVDSVRAARELSVLVLLDISGSAGEPSRNGTTVHDNQCATAASLLYALHDLGDRVALYGFRSLGRNAVHVVPVKRFDEHLDARVVPRLGALAPGAYTRLGAAIRHGTTVLESHGGTPRRILVVISDGFAYDHGYEGEYGEADARRALAEARRRGIGCLCLSVGAATEPEALRRVFGTAAHATLSHPDQLPAVVGPLFRAALRSAESQQRTWQRAQRARERLAVDRRTA
jgi:Mg-chelatase subunit ChlD